MKKVLIMCVMGIMFIAQAANGSQKCTITEVITPILPEGQGSVLLECDDVDTMEVGDKVKLKVKKATAVVEGC